MVCPYFKIKDNEHILKNDMHYTMPKQNLQIPSSQYWEWGLSSDLGYHGNIRIYVAVTSEQLMLTHIVCMCMLAAFFLMALCCVHSYVVATARV